MGHEQLGQVGDERGVLGSLGYPKIVVPGGAFYRDFGAGIVFHHFGLWRTNGNAIVEVENILQNT